MTRKNEAGQALIAAVTALSIVLMGFAGLGVDMGYLRYEKRLQQTAADSAAIAGAAELLYGTSGVAAAAKHDAAANGFTDTTGNTGCPTAVGCVTVTVNRPPLSGPHATVAGYVEVYVAQVQPTFFMRILRINSETVTARAVATDTGGSSGCLYLLGTSGDSILLNGPDTINAQSCGIQGNGNLSTNGPSTITASSIGVAGTYTHNGPGTATPTPVTGIVPAPDPLAYLTAPSRGSCTAQNGHINGTANITLNPGNFCSGISINGTGNITFSSGVYSITGGSGFSDNGSGTLTGNGVMFYNTAGTINLNGSNTINLTAPTTSNAATGQVAGMLFWQASSDTSGPSFNGSNSSVLEGILYFPGAQITMNGNNSLALYTIVVAQSLRMNGNNSLTTSANTSGLTGGSPIKNALLVE
jgi:hypothetical protein